MSNENPFEKFLPQAQQYPEANSIPHTVSALSWDRVFPLDFLVFLPLSPNSQMVPNTLGSTQTLSAHSLPFNAHFYHNFIPCVLGSVIRWTLVYGLPVFAPCTFAWIVGQVNVILFKNLKHFNIDFADHSLCCYCTLCLQSLYIFPQRIVNIYICLSIILLSSWWQGSSFFFFSMSLMPTIISEM